MNHPSNYGSFVPNHIIDKNWTRELSIKELNVLFLALGYDHVNNKETRVYTLDYSNVSSNKSKASREIPIIEQSFNTHKFPLSYDALHFICHSDGFEEFTKTYKDFLIEKKDVDIKPFITIQNNRGKLKYELHPLFKATLVCLQNNFTKVDTDFVLNLKYDVSKRFYMHARVLQKERKEHILTLDEIRSYTGTENSYEKWGDLNRHVLVLIHKEYKGHFIEFTYEPIRKGKGGKINTIRLVFTKGFADEKFIPAGNKKAWEKPLLNLGFHENQIMTLRTHCEKETKFISEEGLDCVWSDDYILICLEIAKQEYERKKKTNTPVGHKVKWFWDMLIYGRWYPTFLIHLEKKQNTAQQSLFNESK